MSCRNKVVMTLLLAATLIFVPKSEVSAVKGVSTNDANSNVRITTSTIGNSFSIRLTNSSGDTMKNVSVRAKGTNSHISNRNIINIGSVKDNTTINIDISGISVKNTLIRKICNTLGGYYYLVMLVGVFLISCLLLSMSLFLVSRGNKTFKNKYIVVLSCSCLAVFVFASSIIFIISSRDKYTPLNTGDNFVHTVEAGEGWVYEVRYNQDALETVVSESDEEIDFDTKYEYAADRRVTEDPIIKTKGIKGLKHVITTTTYRNGKVDKVATEETVVKEPSKEVAIQGTKAVLKMENLAAKKTYVPDYTMKAGEYELVTELSDSRDNIGKKEVTYEWDYKSKRVNISEEVTKEPGVNTWKAGTLVSKAKTIKASTRYVALEDRQVGYENVVKESKDGSITTFYRTEIDTTTGKPIEGAELVYDHATEEDPIEGKVELGVLNIQELTTHCKVHTKYDDSKWDNYVEVTQEGKDQIDRVTSIMKIDVDSGKVSDEVEKEVSRVVLQDTSDRYVIKGSKSPNWVEEKVMTDKVQYNTVYEPDKTGKLVGDASEVIQKGEYGRLYTTYLIACDDDGNRLDSYEPKVIKQDALVKPKDEIIRVAKNSRLLMNEGEENGVD